MDITKARVKTTSNSSLRSTYTAHGSRLPPASATSRGRPSIQRQPLRSISHNSGLPPSPGPLTSMLKTTTEMGDVGTFLAQQRPITPMSYHPLYKSRPDLVAATPPPRYTPRRCENLYYAGDYRPFRPYRDTTSEIISLYAYDGQPVYFDSGSPMLDDASNRSYSITTKSSRHFSSQKPPGIVQSHSSRGELQRPRSPFPYPARLRRPGVRPVSPAVADNGYVDYSRMIEPDRVVQRTAHGSYKPNSSKWSRRPPLSSVRPDYNRSASSLPLRGPPSPYHARSGSYRSRTPNSSQSGASRHGHLERHRMPFDHEERSPSLSSIVAMYRRPSVTKDPKPSNRTPYHFYYDYSEDFDKPSAVRASMEQEPLRVSSGRLDIVSNDAIPDIVADISAMINVAVHEDGIIEHERKEGDTASSKADKGGQPIAVVSSDYSEGSHELGDLVALRRLSQSAPLELRKRGTQNIRENQDDLVSSSAISKMNLPRMSAILGSSSGQALPDFASIFGSFDLLARSPCFKSADACNMTKVMNSAESIHSADGVNYAQDHLGKAAKNNETDELEDELEFPLVPSVQNQKLDILSPEPISPVRGLKVKNSIPQLMKALPPLPSKFPHVQNMGNTETMGDSKQLVVGAHQDAKETQDECQDFESPSQKGNLPLAKRESPSKFKVRMKTATSPLAISDGTGYSQDPTQPDRLPEVPLPQPKPKLKIKISRAQLGQGRCATDGTHLRVNRLKQCNSLADLALYSPKPPKTANSIEALADKMKRESCADKIIESFDGAGNIPVGATSPSPQPSDPFNIPYPLSPDSGAGKDRSISSSNKDTLVPMPSSSSGTSLHQIQGLRKKISVFRLRLVEPFSANAAKKMEKCGQVQQPSESHLSVNILPKDSSTNMASIGNHTGRSNRLRSDWMAARVRRWAMDARRAVRSYVRRTLDRAPRGNE